MAKMLNLSTELLIETFSYLPTTSLHALTLVNLTFNTISTPLLYQTFSFEVAGPRFHSFLQTIIQQPSLAQTTRFVKLRRWRQGLRSRTSASTALSTTLFTTTAKDVGIYRDRAYPWDVADQEMELLVSLLPNLRELELWMPPVCEAEWKAIGREGEKARKGDMGAKFGNLRRVVLRSDPAEVEIELRNFEPFLRLPSLKSLEVRSFETVELEREVEGLEEEVRKRVEITFGSV